jgi:surface antigen
MRYRVALVAALIALSGCTTAGKGGGSFFASNGASDRTGEPAVAGTIIASMRGGLIGGPIGSSLSDADRRAALQAEYRALEYTPAGDGVEWASASAGVGGEVTAAQPYRVGSQDCRQYTHSVSSGGVKQTARGTACRNPDGSWTPLT